MNEQTNAQVAWPPCGLVEYTDNNYAGHFKDRKSVIDHCFYVNEAVVSLYSKKQYTVSTSIIKAKYIAFSHTVWESV